MENKIKPSIKTFEAAIAEYHKTGKVTTIICEKCHTPISASSLGASAIRIKCVCGIYNDNLRGL